MMSRSPAHSEYITAGTKTFKRWTDLEILSITRQLEEIDPNLALVRTDDGGWGVLWNGPDAQWHAVCFNRSGSRYALQALPSVLRERDRNSPTNSRESAFERDVRAYKERQDRQLDESTAALTEDALRVYAALRKDEGHHLGITRQRYFSFATPSKKSNVDSWD